MSSAQFKFQLKLKLLVLEKTHYTFARKLSLYMSLRKCFPSKFAEAFVEHGMSEHVLRVHAIQCKGHEKCFEDYDFYKSEI